MLFSLFPQAKSEVLEKYKEFEAAFTVGSGQRVGKLQTNNDGDYFSNNFSILQSKAICHELMVTYSPQQNRMAERMN